MMPANEAISKLSLAIDPSASMNGTLPGETRLQEQVAFRMQDVPAPVPALLVEQFLPLASIGVGDRAHSHAPPQASKALNPMAATA